MKKKIILGIAILASMVSCSTEETQESQSIKTSVLLDLQAGSSKSTTGKQINRENKIPVSVKTIAVKATNIQSGRVVGDNWDVVSSGGDSFIQLKDIEVGDTRFEISTTTDSPKFKELTNFGASGSDQLARFNSALNNINKENPYALYNGLTTQKILATDLNAVKASMTTQHGRILTVFQLKDALKNHAGSKDGQGFQANITATVEGQNSQVAITKKSELVTFKWSDDTALSGKKVTYKVEIASINDQNKVLETYTITQNILASTSLSCFYELDFKDFSLTRKDVGIELSWQEWVDAHCIDCNI